MTSPSPLSSTQTNPTAAEWVAHFDMTPHPEGGFYKEIYRSTDVLAPGQLPSRYPASRSLGTSIYYLLPTGTQSVFHRLISDEIWYYHAGGAMEVLEITPEGEWRQTWVGPNLQQGETLQHVVPKGHWFAARPSAQADYSLVGCVVFPGFDFADFEMADRQTLVSAYPQFAAEIQALTH